jgi:PTS system nitrogen regulatory IIA component
MTILTSLATWAVRRRATPRNDGSARGVVMHVTLDACHAASLRHALSCDCAGDGWTMRIAPLPESARVRLSLYLPKTQVDTAISRIESQTPDANIHQVIELPYAPTDAWRDLARVRAAELCLRGRRTPCLPPARQDASIRELLTRERVIIGLNVANRSALFQWVGERLAAEAGLDAATITAALHAREQSGSTALGHGFAIPHGRLAPLREPLALYVRFSTPLDLDAPDAQPVVDAVILLVPSWAGAMHLTLLAEIAQRFCNAGFRDRLRKCKTVSAALACIRYET